MSTDDLRIDHIEPISSPKDIINEIALTEKADTNTQKGRQAIHNILHDQDDRLAVIVGPCSIHDIKAAIEYAERLKIIIDRYADDLHIMMRVYFEKPRTTVGWKGLINDPDLNEEFNINKGLRIARQLLLDLNEMGITTATEYLDLITPQYIADLISWGAIGARTTESQLHRQLASALSCPVGFKNATHGSTQVAVDAIRAAMQPHSFLSIRKDGGIAIFHTKGNEDCHIILRGGEQPNYDKENVHKVSEALAKVKLSQKIMIDFSHANSQKNYALQIDVGNDVAQQIASGEQRIFGVMIESYLVAGRQDKKPNQPLTYGQSITDPCLGWDDTVQIIEHLASATKKRNANK